MYPFGRVVLCLNHLDLVDIVLYPYILPTHSKGEKPHKKILLLHFENGVPPPFRIVLVKRSEFILSPY
jgi:hypothetical protein